MWGLSGVSKWDAPVPPLPIKPSTRFQLASEVTVALLSNFSLRFQNIFSNSVKKNHLTSLIVVYIKKSRQFHNILILAFYISECPSLVSKAARSTVSNYCFKWRHREQFSVLDFSKKYRRSKNIISKSVRIHDSASLHGAVYRSVVLVSKVSDMIYMKNNDFTPCSSKYCFK